jgi:hypothetical protein
MRVGTAAVFTYLPPVEVVADYSIQNNLTNLNLLPDNSLRPPM